MARRVGSHRPRSVDVLTRFGEVAELLTALFTLHSELTVKVMELRSDLVAESRAHRAPRATKATKATKAPRSHRKTGRPRGRPPKVKPEPAPKLTRVERGVSRRETA